MKAILVIDIPNYVDFNICKTVDVALSFNVKEYTEPFIKSNVPLKPMPEEFTVESLSEEKQGITKLVLNLATMKVFADGYNACLEEINK